MTRKLVLWVGLSVALFAGTANASTILVSSMGSFGDPNAVLELQFAYDPLAMGSNLIIQTYGYGGSSNAPGGTNAAGAIIAAGGFDPIIALYFGAVSGGGAKIAGNDDQGSNPTNIPCGPGSGAVSASNCFDSRLVFNGLGAGTYTLALAVFGNTPPTRLRTVPILVAVPSGPARVRSPWMLSHRSTPPPRFQNPPPSPCSASAWLAWARGAGGSGRRRRTSSGSDQGRSDAALALYDAFQLSKSDVPMA